MTVELRPVTAENFQECINLKVKDEQADFCASNLYSIAESKVEPAAIPVCIYLDGAMVGFILYGPEEYKGGERMWIDRFMIDARYQGRGYGKLALAALLAAIRRDFDFGEVYLSYVPENEIADKLYGGFGFVKTGDFCGDECEAVLTL